MSIVVSFPMSENTPTSVMPASSVMSLICAMVSSIACRSTSGAYESAYGSGNYSLYLAYGVLEDHIGDRPSTRIKQMTTVSLFHLK